MIEEHQNFGLAGGTLKVVRSSVTALAFELTIESERRWHEAEAQLYLELGLDAAEYHANWGVARTAPACRPAARCTADPVTWRA